MGRFSRKIKRNPARGFVGKKVLRRNIQKMFMSPLQDYQRQLKEGLIAEDGTPIEQETSNE